MKFLEFWIKEEDTDGKAYLRPASLGEVKEVLKRKSENVKSNV